MSDINELRRLAQMATPGPWHFWRGWVAADIDNDGGVVIVERPTPSGGKYQARVDANFKFIAATNPQAILELLDRLEDAEKERDALRAENEALAANLRGKHSTTGATYAHLIEDRDELRAKVDAMERQEPVAWARKLAMDLPSFGCVTDLKYRPSNMPESAYMPLYALPGAAPEPSESEARMRWLLRQIVHALPSRRDWLDPAIDREARIATTPEANHDPR